MRARGMTPGLVTCLLLMASGPSNAAYFLDDIVDAARRGDYHAVHKLLEERPEAVTETDASGYTALHWAGIRGHWRIFQELLAAGAPVDAIGGDGGTPLHWACHHDRADMVELLLDAGAELEVHNRWGRTPLHVAARRCCREVAALLLARGADVNAATREGWTPLHVAARSGHAGMVALLEAHGADSQLEDAEGLRAADSTWQRPAEITLEPTQLAEYTGRYDLGDGVIIKVWLDGEQLCIREYAPDELSPIAVDRFCCRREPWQVVFTRDDSGAVRAVEVQSLRRSVTGGKLATPRYVGSRACIDCHSSREQGNQYVHWLQSRHAHAYWRLGADWALFLGRLRPQYHDLSRPMQDHRCLLCHVTGTQDPDNLFAPTFRPEEGVSCEACHGPGSQYLDPEIMADRQAFLAAGGIIPDERTCRRCHRNSDRFDFTEWWPKIAHQRPEPQSPEHEG